MIQVTITTECSEETSVAMAWVNSFGPDMFADAFGDMPFEFVLQQLVVDDDPEE